MYFYVSSLRIPTQPTSMQFFSVAVLLSLVAAAQAFVHVVKVGNAQGQTIYNPNNIVRLRISVHIVMERLMQCS